MTVLLCLSISLIGGLMMSRIAKKLNLPAVTAYLVTGLLLGPFCVGALGLAGLGFNTFDQVEELGVLSNVALGFIAVRLFRVPEKERGVWLFVASFSNNGFMGLPLAMSLYGNEGVFLMSIMNMIANLLIFSAGVKMLTAGYPLKEKLSVKKMLLTNINIAVVLGLIFYINQWTLPTVLGSALDYLGSITSGLSMVVVGLSMAKLDIKSMFQGHRNYIITALRLVVIPLITLALIRTLGRGLDPVIAGTLLLTSGLPSPSAVSIIAEQYHTNVDLGARMIFLTTLFCMVTVPLFMGIGLG